MEGCFRLDCFATNLPMPERRNMRTRPLFEPADGSYTRDQVFFDLITEKIGEKIEEGSWVRISVGNQQNCYRDAMLPRALFIKDSVKTLS